MEELNAVQLIIPAFIAGLITFLAPCTLPLVPGYLGFVSGVNIADLQDPEKAKKARWKIFKNGAMFVLGFSLVFILFGVFAGAAGSVLGQYRVWFSRIGGFFVILFGLFMLNILKIPFLSVEKRLTVPKVFQTGKPISSLILGSAFGIGWTPCVGPILGSILFLAAGTSTALQGALLLAIFSAGLAVPFLLIALGIGHAGQFVTKISKYLQIVTIIGGIFLIFLGYLLLTDNLLIFIGKSFEFFKIFNYEGIYKFL